MFNPEECPNLRKDGYNHCSIHKQYDYNCNCALNDGKSYFGNKLCFIREKYFKEHSETYIQFGKYKYFRYVDLPNNYIAWLLKQDIHKYLRCILEDVIIEKQRKVIIEDFIRLNYQQTPYTKGSNREYSNNDTCPPWLDYGSDLFDVMQDFIY